MFHHVDLLTTKTKALASFETSGTNCPVLCHTPEDWNLRIYSGWMKPPMTSSSWYAYILLWRTHAYTHKNSSSDVCLALLLRTEAFLISDPAVTVRVDLSFSVLSGNTEMSQKCHGYPLNLYRTTHRSHWSYIIYVTLVRRFCTSPMSFTYKDTQNTHTHTPWNITW